MDRLPTIALSIQQPWAWLIVNGIKDIENRDWRTTFRGPVLIHTGLRIDQRAAQAVRAGQHPVTGDRSLEGNCYPATLMHPVDVGGIIGVAEVVDCVAESRSEWFVGDYGFVLRNAHPLPFMPLKGQLGFFKAEYRNDG